MADDKLLEQLQNLFVNRFDTYAVQEANGTYTRSERPLTSGILESHLKGKATVGAYQLAEDSTVKYLAFDFDPEKLENPKEAVLRILRVLFEDKEEADGVKRPQVWSFAVMLEASRYPDPSFHIWVFFDPPIYAKVANWLGYRVLELANLNPKQIEVFPKQTEITKDRPFGNFVKLPCGMHQVEKKWSRILNHTTFEPLPYSTLFEFRGISFNEVDIAKILSACMPKS